MFTCIFSVLFFCFFCPTISKRSKAKMIHTQREKKRVKMKEIQLSVPCCDPPQMERKTDTRYKNITICRYQTACGGWFRARRGLLPSGSACFFFFFLITSCSSNCPTHSDALCINFCFFVFTLQNYTSIHIFSSLNSCFDRLSESNRCSIPQLRLQNSFCF